MVSPVWPVGAGAQFNSFLVIRTYDQDKELVGIDDSTPFILDHWFPLNQFLDPTTLFTNFLTVDISKIKVFCSYGQTMLIGIGQINNGQDYYQDFAMQFTATMLDGHNVRGSERIPFVS